MIPLPQPTANEHRQKTVRSQLEEMGDRLEANERRIVQLENTLHGVARVTGDITITYPCLKCDRSLLLIRDGMLYCPCCHYRQTV
ncbi:hypothetical protein OB955_06910 [Halobacteria archaeon AArc-m2/3/4]|uniref:Uncharacterized protein n=1 Tax=Natronoglomus mannanivorans TaxID=2979990 RepID=A0AAP3E1F7_9EURY|nr:hypothetical protein [Halobacteria archaeon AArc-xg1-1]MCU4972467.1 hypothetical protein [Halobacteria archaeon AArc-m2/3/4]